MQNVATISKGTLGEQAKASCEDFHIRKTLARFRRFIETADWDKGYLLNEGMDSFCRCLLVAAFIFFLAPLF